MCILELISVDSQGGI